MKPLLVFTCAIFFQFFIYSQLFREVRIMKYLDHPNIGRSSVMLIEAPQVPQHTIPSILVTCLIVSNIMSTVSLCILLGKS